MKTKMMRLLSLLLAAVILTAALPVSAGAAAGDHKVYVYAEDAQLESVSGEFWSWEWFKVTLTGANDYRKVVTPAYEWKDTVSATIDHENGLARLDFKRNILKELPSTSEFSTKVAAYGAERGDKGRIWERTNNQYVWSTTYKYYRAREYMSKTPASATLYVRLVTDDSGKMYLIDPIWDGDPYCGFRLELEHVAESTLIGEPTGGLDIDKARAYAANPASPPALVLGREVTVDDVLYEYIGQVVGCTASDHIDEIKDKLVVGRVDWDNQLALTNSIGGKDDLSVSSAVGKALNSGGKRTEKTITDSAYNTLFPENIRRQLEGEGTIGKCKDVKYDSSKGIVNVEDNGRISICPTSPNQVLSIKVNGKEVAFTMNYGWAVLENMRTTDKVEITFGLATAFTDVPANAYYKDAVNWAVERKITDGMGNNSFKPNLFCTRAQIVTFLWRMAGEPAPSSSYNPFRDVKPGAYYYKAVLWAVEKNITGGMGDNCFKPDLYCTRGQICTFLWRYMGYPVGTGSFRDVPANAYYANAVAWAATAKVTGGTGNGKFSPNDFCTRGQGVTFLYRARNITPSGNTGGSTAADNDKTGYVPKSWSWDRDGTEGYGLRYFTSGKYVRKDGRAVLYIESSTSSDFFDFQLYVMAGNGKGDWARPNEWDSGDYMDATIEKSGEAGNGLEHFIDNGSHTITIENAYEDSMPVYYNMPDGDYVLVREK